MGPKDTIATLSAKFEPALDKIESFVALADKLEAVLSKIEELTPFAAKLEAALIRIEEQASEISAVTTRLAVNEAALIRIDEQANEISALKTRLAVNEAGIAANNMTADIAQRLANNNAQYARRETVEFYNFPKSIPDKEVEAAVVMMLSATGVKVIPSDFQAVHRKKNPKIVIAKLKYRKKAREIINKRAGLKQKTIELGK